MQPTLEELLAERIAQEAARIAEERVRQIVSLEVLDPDEILGPMTSEEAAEWMGVPYSHFREIAKELPRVPLTPGGGRWGYLRRELLDHLRRQRGDFGHPLG